MLKSKLLVVVLSLSWSTAVFAQAVQDGQAKDSGAAVDFDRATKMSDSDKLSTASIYVGEMRSVLSTVLGLLKEARAEKDVIKINCVNEKLTNIKGLIRISEQADVTLQEAVAKGERDTAAHEFHKIAISHQKIKVLKTEAEQCVGELAFAVGKTTVEVEVDENQVPELDPTIKPLPETPVIRPPAASPYQ
jgi:hypothetical protein